MFIKRAEFFAKLFFLLSCTGFLLYVALAVYSIQSTFSNLDTIMKTQNRYLEKRHKLVNDDLLYILIWTVKLHPSVDLVEGQDMFVNNKCSYTNCYVTSNKNFQNTNLKRFDAIVFNVSTMTNWRAPNIPKSRPSKQKYVFHSMESSSRYPICNIYMDTFFNLTWTYKLDSDIPQPQFEVTDLKGNLVAPKNNVMWDKTKHNLTDEIQYLERKRKAMVWIVNNCKKLKERIQYAKRLQSAFRNSFLDFDIFGCGFYECPDNICYRLIKQDYYFYFVPEDNDGTDYVTKDVLRAYDNYAVPVVIGNADYKRFLPEGSYINIKSTAIEAFVELVKFIMKSPDVHRGFHTWRKTYSIQEVKLEKGFCDLCVKLNEWKGTTIKRKFRKWWFRSSLHDRCIPGGAETYVEVLSYANESRRNLKSYF